MAPKRKKPAPPYEQFRKAHHRYYTGQLNEAEKTEYKNRYQALYNDYAAADWTALETTRPDIAAAYRELHDADYDRDQAPPTADNNFALPTFIHVEEPEDSEIEEPEDSEIEEPEDSEIEEPEDSEIEESGEGRNDEESDEGNNSEDPDGEESNEESSEEEVSLGSNERVDTEKSDEDHDIEPSDKGTPLGERAAADVDDSHDENDESEESEEFIFDDRGEPDNALGDAEFLPLTITVNEGTRISSKEFETLDLEEYPSNEWLHITAEDKEGTKWKWFPKTRLGQGACGRATLWVEVDEEGTVGGSAVAKDVNFEKEWDSKNAWWDTDHDIPMEVAAHRTVCSLDLSPEKTLPVFMLPYRGFHVHNALRCYRLLTEPALDGDLFGLMQKFPLPGPKEKGKDKPETPQDMIPVAFAWRVFLALIQAAIHIHAHGIIHRDLKPENILLMNNEFVRINQDGEAEEPTEAKEMEGWNLKPVIGDFGSARPMEREGFNNPDDFDMKGHPPYFAPEELRTEPAVFGHAKKINEKTTVFHLGCCMHQFLHGGKLPRVDANKKTGPLNPPEPVWRHQYENPVNAGPLSDLDKFLHNWNFDEEVDPEIDWDAYDRHFTYIEPVSEDGINFGSLIADCLRFDPDDRPLLSVLLGKVQTAVHRFPGPPSKADHDLVHGKKRKRQPGEEEGDHHDHGETSRVEKSRKIQREKGL
ncbi:hypothetical protein EG327_009420 [Venturia inaequalis]|uniref:Protein kinase domain-containing protein n=1 Tax=Venturia inaequalis TaxID=5025 RepID=A0A8H3ULX2_VENIN|nr:hypothetical protein EG327_009420 [Venturia inaequalis]